MKHIIVALLLACGCANNDPDPGPAMQDVGTHDASDRPDADPVDMSVEDAGSDDEMPASSCASAGCSDGLVCDVSTDICVACLDASHCSADTPVCRRNECITCLTDAECMLAGESNSAAGPTCHSDGRCVSCETDSDCPATSPFCGTDNACFACTADDECPAAAPLCADGDCVSCADGDGCTNGDRYREMLTGACVSSIRLEGLFNEADAIQAANCANPSYGFDPQQAVIEAAVESGRLMLDLAEFERCRRAGTSCAAVFIPTVADGASCWFSGECLSGRCDEGGTCPGTCRAAAAEGEGCTLSNDCRVGLTCVGATCVSPPDVGEPCNGLCAVNAYCDAGFCVARGNVGATCLSASTCLSGLICDPGLGICSNLPGAGEPCLLTNPRPCVEGVRCLNTICQTPQPVGSACTDSAQCAELLRCVDGACVEILLPGAYCEDSAHCARGLRCLGGRCQPLPDVGEACLPADGCIRGDCDGTTCVSRPVGAACDLIRPYSDYLDVCGDTRTCGSDGAGGGVCVDELGQGAVCGMGQDCQAPNLTCRSGTCDLACGLLAP